MVNKQNLRKLEQPLILGKEQVTGLQKVSLHTIACLDLNLIVSLIILCRSMY